MTHQAQVGHGDAEKNGGPKKNDMLLDLEWKVQILYMWLREHYATLNGVTSIDSQSMKHETVWGLINVIKSDD